MHVCSFVCVCVCEGDCVRLCVCVCVCVHVCLCDLVHDSVPLEVQGVEVHLTRTT